MQIFTQRILPPVGESGDLLSSETPEAASHRSTGFRRAVSATMAPWHRIVFFTAPASEIDFAWRCLSQRLDLGSPR